MSLKFKILNKTYLSKLKAYAIDGDLIEGKLVPDLQCIIEEQPDIEMKIDAVAISGIPDNNTFSILVKSFTNNIEETDITGKHLISALVKTSDESGKGNCLISKFQN